MSARGGAGIRVVIAGGGTGGHLFPALALADQLRDAHDPALLMFVGAVGGIEERVVPAAGYDLQLLETGKLRGGGAAARVRALLRLPAAIFSAGLLLRRARPHVVVGMGGYASAAAALAAAALRIPVVLLEQNAIPGATNRALARFAHKVVISFRRAARHLPEGTSVLLGNPVRRELLSIRPGPPGAPPCLLVLGGSQGAHPVNELVTAAAPGLLAGVPGARIIHQTGADDRGWVERRYREMGAAATVSAFIDDMTVPYREADLVIGRSGATTLAELTVVGLPAVLIPFPYAADDHQAANAEELVDAGGALMLRQGSLEAEELSRVLVDLLRDRPKLAKMGDAMRSRGHPDAAERIAGMLVETFVKLPQKDGQKVALTDR